MSLDVSTTDLALPNSSPSPHPGDGPRHTPRVVFNWTEDSIAELRSRFEAGEGDAEIMRAMKVGSIWSVIKARHRNRILRAPSTPVTWVEGARQCKHCGGFFSRLRGEQKCNFDKRMTCGGAVCMASSRQSPHAKQLIEARNALPWPKIDRDFIWPSWARFDDLPPEYSSDNMGHNKMHPEPRVSMTGNAAQMMLNGEEGSTGRRK